MFNPCFFEITSLLSQLTANETHQKNVLYHFSLLCVLYRGVNFPLPALIETFETLEVWNREYRVNIETLTTYYCYVFIARVRVHFFDVGAVCSASRP